MSLVVLLVRHLAIVDRVEAARSGQLSPFGFAVQFIPNEGIFISALSNVSEDFMPHPCTLLYRRTLHSERKSVNFAVTRLAIIFCSAMRQDGYCIMPNSCFPIGANLGRALVWRRGRSILETP